MNPSKGNETMINGVVRATSGSGTLNNPPGNNQVSGSDFTLVELNSNIPNSYNAFYAGWDRSNTAPTNGVSIHHPAGSAKKISTYSSNLTSDTYNGERTTRTGSILDLHVKWLWCYRRGSSGFLFSTKTKELLDN